MKKFTIKLSDSPDYVQFLKYLTDILELVNKAKDNGENQSRFYDSYVVLGKGEYTPLIFEALYSIGVKADIGYSKFLGSYLSLTWDNEGE